jgi:eukaryotic-like serine/threonine-protein kinase
VQRELTTKASSTGVWQSGELLFPWRRTATHGAAVDFALAGAVDHAQSLASQLDKRFPQDTLVKYIDLPSIRGAIALRQKDPVRAVQALEVVRP